MIEPTFTERDLIIRKLQRFKNDLNYFAYNQLKIKTKNEAYYGLTLN